MKTIITIIALITTLLTPTIGVSSQSILSKANTLFGQAVDTEDKAEATLLLDKALLRYEQLYRDKPTGRLAYNIGNTYYQMNNKPMALVFYKRALAMIPTDSNLHHNLEIVREELDLDSTKQQETIWIITFLRNYQIQFFLTLYGLFWLTTSLRYAKKSLMPIAIPIGLLFLTLASSTVIGMAFLQPSPEEGVIITRDTTGRQGNGRNFEPSFEESLAIGTEFLILEKRGYWLRIQLDRGEECWIPARSCEVV